MKKQPLLSGLDLHVSIPVALSPQSGLPGMACTVAVLLHILKEARQYSFYARSPYNKGIYFLPHTHPPPLQELG